MIIVLIVSFFDKTKVLPTFFRIGSTKISGWEVGSDKHMAEDFH